MKNNSKIAERFFEAVRTKYGRKSLSKILDLIAERCENDVITERTLQRWKSGESQPTPKALLNVCRALDLPFDSIMNGVQRYYGQDEQLSGAVIALQAAVSNIINSSNWTDDHADAISALLTEHGMDCNTDFNFGTTERAKVLSSLLPAEIEKETGFRKFELFIEKVPNGDITLRIARGKAIKNLPGIDNDKD